MLETLVAAKSANILDRRQKNVTFVSTSAYGAMRSVGYDDYQSYSGAYLAFTHYFTMRGKLSTWIMISSLAVVLSSCSDRGGHVKNDPGNANGMTGAVSSDMGTNGSGALSGYAANNGDPVANTGNLSSSTSASDPANGINRMNGPALPY